MSRKRIGKPISERSRALYADVGSRVRVGVSTNTWKLCKRHGCSKPTVSQMRGLCTEHDLPAPDRRERLDALQGYRMPLGKYKGLTLRELYRVNVPYLHWASNTLTGPAGLAVREFMEVVQ